MPRLRPAANHREQRTQTLSDTANLAVGELADARCKRSSAADMFSVVRKNGMTNEYRQPSLSFNNLTPTLFVDFDGTLHRGSGLLDAAGGLSLDAGNPPFEFAPLLAGMLEPYPLVEIVLTSLWMYKLSLEQMVSYLPEQLARRVVGSTLGYKARFLLAGRLSSNLHHQVVRVRPQAQELARNRRFSLWRLPHEFGLPTARTAPSVARQQARHRCGRTTATNSRVAGRSA